MKEEGTKLKRQEMGSRAKYTSTVCGPPESTSAPGAPVGGGGGGGGGGSGGKKPMTYIVRIDNQLNDIFGVSI